MRIPGEMIKNGVMMFARYLAIPFSMTVVLFVWMPFDGRRPGMLSQTIIRDDWQTEAGISSQKENRR